MKITCRFALAGVALLLALVPGQTAEIDSTLLPAPTARTVNFRHDVYPILKSRCLRCHKGEAPSSGFRLDQRVELLGQTSGKPVVQVGASAKSRLIQLVSGLLPDDEMMPPRGKGKRLSGSELGVLRAWSECGRRPNPLACVGAQREAEAQLNALSPTRAAD